jgi:phosphoserine phosphatase
LAKLNEILREYTGKSVLIVTHTVVLKVLMAYFEGRPLDKIWNPPYIHPACLCKVEVVDDQIHIVLHGDISHYKEEVKTVQNESTLQKGEILWKE